MYLCMYVYIYIYAYMSTYISRIDMYKIAGGEVSWSRSRSRTIYFSNISLFYAKGTGPFGRVYHGLKTYLCYLSMHVCVPYGIQCEYVCMYVCVCMYIRMYVYAYIQLWHRVS